MAKFAKVVDNKIVGVYDALPVNSERVTNFNVHENDYAFIKLHGWYFINKVIPDYDPTKKMIGDTRHWIENDEVYETYDLFDIPEQKINIPQVQQEPRIYSEEELKLIEEQNLKDQWYHVRAERDNIIKNFEWRYFRREREIRMGLNPTDKLENLDKYVQELADITKQPDPFNIIWPNYIES